MQVRWWPHTPDPSVASTRLRCLKVMTGLRELAPDEFDVGLYRPGVVAPDILVLSKRYDAVSIDHARVLASGAGTQLVLDICDNHFYCATDDAGWRQRREDLQRAAMAVDVVVVSSSALAATVASEVPGLAAIRIIGDMAEPPSPAPTIGTRMTGWRSELELARLRRWLNDSAVPRARRMVWFGNHGSPNADGGMLDLHRIRDAIEQVAAEEPASLTVISNNRPKFDELRRGWTLPVSYLPWHYTTFSRALQLHGVSVIPAGLNPFTRCKTSNRVASSLLHGLAVVADPIPSYLEYEECILLHDWPAGLRRALTHDVAVRQMIERGASIVSTRYSTTAVCAEWSRLFVATRRRETSVGV